MVPRSTLVQALSNARMFVTQQSANGFREWRSFLVPGPRPVSRGLWRVIEPGVQVLVVESYPCDGQPPLVKNLRPMGVLLLSGCCQMGIVNDNDSTEVTTSMLTKNQRVYLDVPGMRCSVNPVDDPCFCLIVRFKSFSPETFGEPRRIDQLPETHAWRLKQDVRKLLSS